MSTLHQANRTWLGIRRLWGYRVVLPLWKGTDHFLETVYKWSKYEIRENERKMVQSIM
jgi:hypothetical protein